MRRIVLGEGFQLKGQESVDIEPSCLVVSEKSGVLAFIGFAIDNAGFDEELAPAVVAVSAEQRVIEIEKRQPLPGAFGHSNSRCNHSRINGTVIARFDASERRSSAASMARSARMSRFPCRSK